MSLKPENYLKVVSKLNSEMEDSDEFFTNEGICFSYLTNSYVDIIDFMDYVVYNSEMDETYSEEHLENMIRHRMLSFTDSLCKWHLNNGIQ